MRHFMIITMFAFLTLFTTVAGLEIARKWRGIMSSNRNRTNLSGLRLMAWTPLVLVLAGSGCTTLGQVSPRQDIQVAPGVDLAIVAPWALSGQKFSNAYEIIYPNRNQQAIGDEARIVLITELRRDTTDAKQRLLSIARSRVAKSNFGSVGGWPSVELRFEEPLPYKGVKDQGGEPLELGQAQRAIVAIAFDQRILKFDIWVAPDIELALLDEAINIVRSASFTYSLQPDQLESTLEELKKAAAIVPGPPVPPSNPRGDGPIPGHPDLNVTPAPPISSNLSFGELEVVTSPNGLQIAVASNSRLSFSNNGGLNFLPGNPGLFGLNDPTLARGASGNFYLGGIAFPTGTAAALGVTGCANAVSLSTTGGASFAPPPVVGGPPGGVVGYSALCPTTGSLCFPDQPHIAADAVLASPTGQDQLYAVWRNFTPTPCLACPPTCNALTVSPGWQTSVIACSQDGGVTWTGPPLALPGGGDRPRVSVAPDGRVYVVTLDGNSVHLIRFSSCSNGLVPDPGFPITVADGLDVACPLPGIDRCGTGLSSPTIAPDPANASHLFVTYARRVGNGNLIVAKESLDGGQTFGGELLLSGSSNAARFMPWSCSALGTVFAGWYDRTAAIAGANDLTSYFLGSPIFPGPVNLSGTPDPQCASGWPVSPRQQNDSESCNIQPQLAGRCQNGARTGSNNPCDFSTGACPGGESCITGGGVPKYGDYNGIACANSQVITAWTSATAPAGLPPAAGLTLYTSVVSLAALIPSWDRLQFDITTGQDDARDSLEIIANVTGQGSFCLKPSTGRTPDATCPTNGGGATDQTGRSTWENSDGVITQIFTVPTPQTLASGFGSMTLTSLQGTCFGCTGDNWNVENLVVTAVDSTGALAPVVLLNLNSGSASVDDSSCVMRLKEPPNAATATMSLASPPTNVRTYVGGPANGMTTNCRNNGG